jgi:hypothetical protein
MELLNAVARQLLLFAHALAFAFAIVTVIRQDVALLTIRRIDAEKLKSTGRTIALLLGLLWVTGASLIALDATDFRTLITAPKMATKLVVVSILTLNGLLLHWVAFPLMTQPQTRPRFAATICVLCGSISFVTWLYAAFLGVGRLIAPQMDFSAFMGLYGVGLAAGIGIGIVAIRPRLESLISPSETAPSMSSQPTSVAG